MYDDLDFELHFMTTDITWRNITWHNMFWVMTRAVNLISRNFTVKILKAAHQLCSLQIRIPISHLLTINRFLIVKLLVCAFKKDLTIVIFREVPLTGLVVTLTVDLQVPAGGEGCWGVEVPGLGPAGQHLAVLLLRGRHHQPHHRHVTVTRRLQSAQHD